MAKRDSRHTKAQKAGKERDNYTCQICGSTDHVEGHHIVDVFFGGAADADNIVSVCKDCHKNIHRGLIDIFRF